MTPLLQQELKDKIECLAPKVSNFGDWKDEEAKEMLQTILTKWWEQAKQPFYLFLTEQLEKQQGNLAREINGYQSAIRALGNYSQADESGVFVTVSRQAIDEVLDLIESIARGTAPQKEEKECYCGNSLPKAGYVHTAVTCYQYPQDDDELKE